MKKTKKYAVGGGLEESLGGNPYASEKKRKPLPSETIKATDKSPQQSMIDRAGEVVRGAGKRLYENVMGTPEQNAAAEAREAARAKANPEGNEAKFRRMMGKNEEGYKKGGKVSYKSGGSTASKRADGCAVRGKTKGRMV